ncbi:MAG: RNA polymerase sigma factor [Firmicutes bacterium]|nr:RNA polymerase sigma factor [Bacillota bacterium]
MVSDEELARQLQLGNDAAFETLVHRYHGPIFGYIYRQLSEGSEVEDLVQKTFLRVYTRIERYKFPRPFKPWLYRIALNLCRDYWKSQDGESLTLYHEAASEQRVDSIFSRMQTRNDLVVALHSLEPNYKEVLVLRFFQDLKIREIADVLEIPVGTVKWRLFQALKQMKSQLEKGGYSGAAEDI